MLLAGGKESELDDLWNAGLEFAGVTVGPTEANDGRVVQNFVTIQLSELGGDSDTLRQWAERAARKASHTVDDDVEAAKATIVSQ